MCKQSTLRQQSNYICENTAGRRDFFALSVISGGTQGTRKKREVCACVCVCVCVCVCEMYVSFTVLYLIHAVVAFSQISQMKTNLSKLTNLINSPPFPVTVNGERRMLTLPVRLQHSQLGKCRVRHCLRQHLLHRV